MKKIFTFLLAMGSLTAVVAQSGRDYNDNRQYKDKRNNESNDYAYNNKRDNYSAYSRERAFQLEKINRDYDYKVNSVIHSRHIRPSEKNRILHNLDRERSVRIREINDRFDHNRFDDRYDRGNNYHH